MKTVIRVSTEEVAQIVLLAVMNRPENRMRHCAAVEFEGKLDAALVVVFDTMQAAAEYGKPAATGSGVGA